MNEWVWSIGGMILTGETEVLGEKRIKGPFCPPQIHMDWPGSERGPLRRDAGDHLSHISAEQHSWFL